MKTNLIAYLAALIPMLALDAIWLSVMVKTFYVKHIGDLMSSKPNLWPAVVFYVLYICGVLFFVVLPAIRGEFSLGKVFFIGAFLGMLTYMTYDLTNQATLKNWATIVTVVDILWGAFITGLAATISVWFTRMFM